MKSLKIAIVLVAGSLATAIGCGSDNGNKNNDSAVITGTGGTVRLDGGLGGAGGSGGISGTGGAVPVDASISTGGAPGLDAAMGADAPMGLDSNVSEAGGEAGGTVANICAGLSAAACDLKIRNAAVDTTVTAQDVSGATPPAYNTCK